MVVDGDLGVELRPVLAPARQMPECVDTPRLPLLEVVHRRLKALGLVRGENAPERHAEEFLARVAEHASAAALTATKRMVTRLVDEHRARVSSNRSR